MPEDVILCSFCGKTRAEVGTMIKGVRAYICDKCAENANKVIEEARSNTDKDETTKLQPPQRIKEFMDRFVIGQDKAKQVLAVAVFNHYLRLLDRRRALQDDTEIEKANVLMLGPTGCGKTLLAKTIARYLDVPFAIADATTLTEAGFVGDDVEDIVSRLLGASGGDIHRCQRGIIFIDEIDKIGRKGTSSNMVRDVRGEGVQQALLKLVEGSKVDVPQPGHRRLGGGDLTSIDTTNILFICGGAFPGLTEIIERRVNTGGLGFGSKQKRTDMKENELLDHVMTEDLRNYGMIPEFLGRLPVVVTLKELEEDQMVQILTEPRNAYVRQYQKLFEFSDVKLTFPDETLRAVAKKAIKELRGARGLRSILEAVLMPLMYRIPGEKGKWSEVIVTPEVVENGAEATLVPMPVAEAPVIPAVATG